MASLQTPIVALSIVLLSITACATAPKPSRSDILGNTIARAELLSKRNDFDGASQIYRSLAKKAPRTMRGHFRVLTVESLAMAGKKTEALAFGTNIDYQTLSLRDRQQLALLLANLELEDNNAEAAIVHLEAVTMTELDQQERVKYHRLKANAYEQNGNMLDAARERISLEEFDADPQTAKANETAILDALMHVNSRELKSRQPPPPDLLAGWMKIASIIKRFPNRSPTLDNALVEWRQLFPNHPANEGFIFEYLEQRGTLEVQPPSRVAVLLPQSGPFEKAARAINEGFTSAYYSHDHPNKPEIQFYDSHAVDIFTVYQQAIDDGADFVVGPLTKENVRALSEVENLSVPVLALNTVSDLENENLYKFALNPEDDAEQVANSAWSEGYKTAVVFTPSTGLGQRLATHFAAYWEEIGGITLASQSYPPKDSDFSDKIKSLLNLTESEQRYKRLSRMIPNLTFEARRREDIDLVFLVADPRAGRLIRPQLQYFRASHVPIYATSSVYEGQPNPAQDQDLSDMIFCDIPWLLEPEESEDPTVNTIEENWSPRSGIFKRLTALGMDAYTLVTNFGQLRNTELQFEGATGNLSLGPDNRIHRQIYCARFENGRPASVRIAPLLEPEDTEDQNPTFLEAY